MEKTSKFQMIVFLVISVIIAGGLLWFGNFSISRFGPNKDLVEVKGLSERVVKADVAEISLKIENKNQDLTTLYEKRTADKAKVMNFLKKFDITEADIASINTDTSEETFTDSESKKTEKYFKAEDTIFIKTSNLERVNELKSDIVNLSSENVLISCDCTYRFTHFQQLKLDMINEASKNAKENAISFIAPYDMHIKGVSYLRQGEVTIRAENESEDVNSWDSKEKTSPKKRVRLVVRAGFTHD
ncbi:MAG: SIMPL domain-containing protein [Alphaproteobacteria bacterium]|nr:SIMPL domain-containing protein [Alphaproteobacteria bacterium]